MTTEIEFRLTADLDSAVKEVLRGMGEEARFMQRVP